eukprot:TRINITY_DN15844_c0_g1_i1.p1 TRINITY_DN15844_c0_g1~~TRINITY_DN15844_c0_g1_i1.p1  ORF type:complete len:360 (+),score=162.37 TRINITY_DN15844_c0_g1_i1:174-1253(+)
MGERPEDGESEGGWAVSCSGGRVVSTTGHNLFYSSLSAEKASEAVVEGKPIRAIAWAANGEKTLCITAGDDKVVEARDEAMKVVFKSTQLTKKIGQVTYIGAPHNKVLVGDKTGDVYELPFDFEKGFGEAKFILGHTASMITGLEFCYSNKLIATADKDEHVRLTRYPDTHIIERFCFGHDGFVSSLVVLSDDLIATGGGDGQVRVWRVPTGEAVFSDSFEGNTVHDMCLATGANGEKVLLASVDGVGVVGYPVDKLARSEVLLARAPTSLSASGPVVFAAFIGTEAPFLQKFTLAGLQLSPSAYTLPVELSSVKPSYWQLELAKKRALKAGEGTPADLRTKKRARTDGVDGAEEKDEE